MRLPNDSVGISDILAYRDCPFRFADGMRRHTEGETPGSTDWKNAYGSAVHDAIHEVEVNGLANADAVTEVWPKYMAHLDPEDLDLLQEDLEKYRRDTPLGMELVTAEADARIPLFVHNGVQIYFRFKLDALYRRTDDVTVFYHRDYKSSKWRKSQAEVDSDPQMWAYNLGIHELYPECASLLQSYEQLRFGNLPTSKNAEQRAAMKRWLIQSVKALLEDDTLEPNQNEWCAYCKFAPTCSETVRATKYWQGKLAIMAPQTKEGRKLKITFGEEEEALEEAIELLPKMIQARKHLEAVEKTLKDHIEKMPSDERERLGWRLGERKTSYLPPGALRALHEALGDSFYEAVAISKTSLEKVAGKSEIDLMRQLELSRVSSVTVLPIKGA